MAEVDEIGEEGASRAEEERNVAWGFRAHVKAKQR